MLVLQNVANAVSDHSRKAMLLAAYTRSLGSEFVVYADIDGRYDHIGATLADAILQANRPYETVVRPRVRRILEKYPDARTTQLLSELLYRIGIKEFLDYQGPQREQRFRDLLSLLQRERIGTEEELREWLNRGDTRAKLLKVRGIGPKTADYLKILVGLANAAPDIRLLRFLSEAGTQCFNYDDAKQIIHCAADLLGLDRAHYDHSIWRYMAPVPSVRQSSCEE